MFKGLSLDQAPKLSIPLRFFLTAPIFAIIASLFILNFNSGLENRFSSDVIILTHFFTIGFVSMTMIGAMFQMLPVLIGVKFKQQNIIAPLVHILLSVGLVFFVYGFYMYAKIAMIIAMIFLVLAFLLFIINTLFSLKQVKSATATTKGFVLALLSFLLAVLIAIHITFSYATGSIGQYHQILLQMHILFNLLGWITLLIIGVSFQVLPMFYITKAYPQFYRKYAIPIIFSALFVLAIGLIIDNFWLYYVAKIILVLFIGAYAFLSIYLLKTRKRKISDTTINYFYFAMIMLATSLFISVLSSFSSNFLLDTLVATVFIYGFVISMISAMLYKIVPFLVWFHLTNEGYFNVPTMNEIIDKRLTKIQFYLHIASLILLVILIFSSTVKVVAVLVILFSNIFLFYNLINSSKLYFNKKILTSKNYQ